jgi:ribosomal protein S18 acetylase RimI-like enzyme
MAIVRRLQKEDSFQALVELSRQFFAEYEAHHDEFLKIDELRDSDVTDYFAHFLNADNRAAFIALVDDKIVGYITVYIQAQPGYWKVKQVGDISGLMVHEDHRRSGIGRQLVSAAKAFFEEKEIKYYTFYTAATNRAALEFYARNGMTPLYVTLINKTGPQ